MKKIIMITLTTLLLVNFASCQNQNTTSKDEATKTGILEFDSSIAIKDDGKKSFSDVSAKDTVVNMVTGWNLGNTLDATNGGNSLSSETSWQQPLTTQEMIHNLAVSGIKTIRIPVSWANHMNKENYTVDPAWTSRVKQIVDWAIAENMYVIINSHHDNGISATSLSKACGYYPNTKNYEESERYLVNLWSQICLAFNSGYDEHLIFETMNEPRLRNTSDEWWFDSTKTACRDAADALNKLNQVCVDTIRKSGGNNAKRFIMIPALQASPDSALTAFFKMPKDDAAGKLILSVHMYSPYSFAMESPGVKVYTESHKQELATMFSRLNSRFIKAGYPVIVGEYGATNKNNLDDRVKWFSDFISISRSYGITSCLWDNGSWNVTGTDYSEHFGYYNRNEGTWYFPEIIQAILSNSTK